MKNQNKHYKIVRVVDGKYFSYGYVKPIEYKINKWNFIKNDKPENDLYVYDTLHNLVSHSFNVYHYTKIFECEIISANPKHEHVNILTNILNDSPKGTVFARKVKLIREITKDEIANIV